MPPGSGVEQILGSSQWATDTRRRVAQIAPHRYNVTVTGPAGSGKRFLAGVVHELSRRAEKPIIPVDCSLLSEAIFASQLFGHEAGAMPGTPGAALGCFRAATGGTLFLGQVQALPLVLQKPLYDALKSNEIRPLGSDEPVSTDVRIITSSARDLQKEVQERRLLPELYTLLDAVSLETVPLSQRLEDIQALAEQFLADIAEDLEEPPKRLEASGLERLQAHRWPGNVVQLSEVIERAAVLLEADRLEADAFNFLDEH